MSLVGSLCRMRDADAEQEGCYIYVRNSAGAAWLWRPKVRGIICLILAEDHTVTLDKYHRDKMITVFMDGGVVEVSRNDVEII